jgi:tetratricopeptide (TPR) repeat protein
MKNAISLVTLSIFLCACTSSKKTASIHGLTPAQAQEMSTHNAKIVESKPPPVTADVRFAAGQLAESRGDFGLAMHHYYKALDLDPKHLPSLFRLGVVYAELKQYDKSVEIWKRYITTTGDKGDGYGNLGFCYELMGMPKTAVDTYKKGIEKDPKNAPCRTNYGIMLARENKIPDALRMWNPVLTDAQIHYNLASIYQGTGRKAEAKAEYEKALDSDPTLIDARARLSELSSD